MSTVNYRAMHTKTKWRKVRSHDNLENALNGKDGAAGLFAGKVRIDYTKHGDPLYAFIWEDGATQGWAVKPSSDGISKRQVSLHLIMALENSDGGSQTALARIFSEGATP
jgi:5-methylcytosine-specific restriction protein A